MDMEPGMLEAASGNVGSGGDTAGVAADAAAGAAAAAAEKPAAETSVDFEDQHEALLRNCLANMQRVNRKRLREEM